jgi:hypothetical protein
MKDCGCQETVFTNSLVGTKTGGRPAAYKIIMTLIPDYLEEYKWD